jgi:cupin 2 domain-containing protein
VEKGSIHTPIPDDLNHEIFDTLVQSGEVKIERIVSKGHTSPDSGWYDQEHDEWVIVLKGNASILFEDESIVSLAEGEYINIPAHRRHRVINTSINPETIWLAVHY